MNTFYDWRCQRNALPKVSYSIITASRQRVRSSRVSRAMRALVKCWLPELRLIRLIAVATRNGQYPSHGVRVSAITPG